ncbi:MAG: hypothetical protein ACLUNV_09210 [Sutterella wadsworthensis]
MIHDPAYDGKTFGIIPMRSVHGAQVSTASAACSSRTSTRARSSAAASTAAFRPNSRATSATS